jgi:ABC-type transport system substrate-binding protein
MEGAAEPGTVLIAEDTYRLVAPLFETEAQGTIQVKGKAEPVPVYRVAAAKALPSKPRGIDGLVSPLVGREVEFIALQAAVERLQSGMGGIVTLVGEAGIGKSRLAAELRNQVGATHLGCASHVKWIESLCLSYGGSIAYLPWLDVLRCVLGVSVEDTPATVREILHDAVHELCPEDHDDVYPYLGRMLSLPLEEEVETALDDLEGEQLRQGTFRAVETLLTCAAENRPLIVVCEDLHWADPTSLELLEDLLPLVDHIPLLFLCVFRPVRDHGSRRIRETVIRNHSHCHTDLTLHALSTADSETLVGNLLRMEHLPRPLQNRILSHAEGNPFYLEEVLRSLIDSGAIAQDEATGQWHATRNVDDIAIPDTLQGVLMARIDRLQDETKRVLQMAAVIGRTFLHRVLAAIAREERGLEARLSTLQQEEMIRERARIPELEYIFKHHLTQEAAYGGLLKAERRATHRQVAEALERLFPERIEELVALLAHHWERAGDREKAGAYLSKAGDKARIAYSNEEAIDYYARALVVLREQDDLERAARVQMKLGLTHHNAFDFRRSRNAYDEGFALWRRAGEARPERGRMRVPAPHALRLPDRRIRSLDPTGYGSANEARVIRELFSTLLEATPDFDVVPDIARDWEVLDGGRTYVLHLRSDVRWSDGMPVTAEDFEYTFRRILALAASSLGEASMLFPIRGSRAFARGETDDPAQVGICSPDSRTLVIELEETAPQFLLTLANIRPVPRHAVEAHGQSWAEACNIVTNGPFLLESWKRDESLVLVRNPSYHGRRRGNVERVEFCVPDGWSGALEMFEAGRIDVMNMEMWGLANPDLERARRRHADDYVSAPAPIPFILPFDAQRAPFDHHQVRQAIVLATDRETLVEVIWRGYYSSGTGGLVPPGMPGHSPGIALPYAPKRARQLLAEAGFPDGNGFPPVEAWAAVELSADCEYLQRQWRENLGIDVQWRLMSTEDLFARLGDPSIESPHMTIYGLVPSDLDPGGYFPFRSPKGDIAWRNEDLERLVAEASTVRDQGKRIALLQQADRLLIEQAVVVPLMYRRVHYLIKPWVRNFPLWMGQGLWRDVVIEPH